MPIQSKFKSKEYRNWVRGALGLGYLQEGLFPFTDDVVTTEHDRIVKQYTPCTNCSIENVIPEHANGACIQKNEGKCNCNKKKKNMKKCPSCSKIYDDIVRQHRFRDPNWVPDCSVWYNDHWQFAKCFLTTTTRGSNNAAKETDASGLLSIIINGEFFQSKLDCTIDPPNDSLSQVRNMRNEILHNSTLQLTDHDVTRYLQSMVTVLKDKKVLGNDPAAQAAVIKLNKIINTDLHITTDEEVKAIQTAMDSINEATKQAGERIRKLDQKQKETESKIIETDRTLVDCNARLRRVEVELKALGGEFVELNQRVDKLEKVKENHQARIDYLNDMKGIL